MIVQASGHCRANPESLVQLGEVGIKVLMGESVGSATITFVGELPADGATPPDKDTGAVDSHAFFGMSVAAAVHKYLTATKKPTTALELANVLRSGGFPSQSDNFGSTITTAL